MSRKAAAQAAARAALESQQMAAANDAAREAALQWDTQFRVAPPEGKVVRIHFAPETKA